MSRHARIEEVSSDSDPSEVDASEYDYDPTSRFPLAARTTPLPPLSDSQALTAQSSSQPSSHLLRPSQIPSPGSSTNPLIQQNQTQDLTPYKSHQALYPVYFSSLHSRAQGRRVSKSLAVPNPLARDIADAVAQLGMSVLFEAGKIHPKDWANPGRVRVLVKKDGKAVNSRVHNSMFRYLTPPQQIH